jgi:hypothetical protein
MQANVDQSSCFECKISFFKFIADANLIDKQSIIWITLK